jgi:Zn-dependent peptidase ImmA (M78 family)
MKRLGEYDPYEHAARLGITVDYHALRTANGIWIPEERVILLRPRMRVLLERSVLAHEVAHATLGHRTSTPRAERQADVLAARRLITPERLLEAARGSSDQGEWCVDLEVTPHILSTYLDRVHVA